MLRIAHCSAAASSPASSAEVRLNDLRLEARIRKVIPAANSQSQTFEVRLELPANAPRLVAAGQLVSVSLSLSANLALTVPRDSVVLREDGAFVMRINDDAKAERVAVEVSEASGDQISVRGELQSGDRVAVRGAEALDDGELPDRPWRGLAGSSPSRWCSLSASTAPARAPLGSRRTGRPLSPRATASKCPDGFCRGRRARRWRG